MKTVNPTILGALADLDGSLAKSGGPINRSVSEVLCKLATLIPIGPATGKNAYHAEGIARGMDVIWDFIVAENGGVFWELTAAGFEQDSIREEDIDELSEFRKAIGLDDKLDQFQLGGQSIKYKPEWKKTIVTLFPPTQDISVTKKWEREFRKIVESRGWSLVVQRHGDGAIDIVPEGIDKGKGVERVCRLLKCKPVNILTVVDGVNDYELAEGTQAIAPANAVDSIKDLVRKQGGYLAERKDGFGFCEGLLHFAKLGAFGEKSGKIATLVENNLSPSTKS